MSEESTKGWISKEGRKEGLEEEGRLNEWAMKV